MAEGWTVAVTASADGWGKNHFMISDASDEGALAVASGPGKGTCPELTFRDNRVPENEYAHP